MYCGPVDSRSHCECNLSIRTELILSKRSTREREECVSCQFRKKLDRQPDTVSQVRFTESEARKQIKRVQPCWVNQLTMCAGRNCNVQLESESRPRLTNAQSSAVLLVHDWPWIAEDMSTRRATRIFWKLLKCSHLRWCPLWRFTVEFTILKVEKRKKRRLCWPSLVCSDLFASYQSYFLLACESCARATDKSTRFLHNKKTEETLSYVRCGFTELWISDSWIIPHLILKYNPTR